METLSKWTLLDHSSPFFPLVYKWLQLADFVLHGECAFKAHRSIGHDAFQLLKQLLILALVFLIES